MRYARLPSTQTAPEESRQEAANRRIAFHHFVEAALAGTGHRLGLAHALSERRPSDPFIDERQRVPAGAARTKQGPGQANVQPGRVAE